ncbi:MAG: hypothetical protein HQM09_05880 [Candidatus Riflebacteria bacterium]|nr:hypothetical protein [Candidatus Riflebacteria bacterium]
MTLFLKDRFCCGCGVLARDNYRFCRSCGFEISDADSDIDQVTFFPTPENFAPNDISQEVKEPGISLMNIFFGVIVGVIVLCIYLVEWVK